MKNVVAVSLQSTQQPLLVETNDELSDLVRAATPEKLARRAHSTFIESVAPITLAAGELIQQLKSLGDRPAEITLEFGIKLGAEFGAVIASGTAESNIAVTMKWSGEKSNAG